MIRSQTIAVYRYLRALYRKLLCVILSGGDYYCPFCNQGFKRFLPYGQKSSFLAKNKIVGAGYRSNCTCPKCLSNDRARLVFLFLKERTNIFLEKVDVLHIAPEKQVMEKLRTCGNINYISGDKDLTHVRKYNELPGIIELDVCNLGFSENRFDFVICNHVIDEIRDDMRALTELFRVVKPGGTAILQVPYSTVSPNTIENKDDNASFVFGRYVRVYSKENYIDRMKEAGFLVQTFNFLDDNKYGHAFVNRHALNPEEGIFVASKEPVQR